MTIEASVEASPSMRTSRPSPKRTRTDLRSSGLQLFRDNPFRLLRLPLSARSDEAVWKAEAAIALIRIGEPPGDDLLPHWLPDADEMGIRRAAEALEEPLQRLCDQLLWFDFERARGGMALRGFLAGETEEVPVLLTDLLSDDSGQPDSDERCLAAVHQLLNAANLQLLLGFSALHGVGPQ